MPDQPWQMNSDATIIACGPIEEECRKHGMPVYRPRAGMEKTNCELCGNLCWIGPRQRDFRAKNESIVVCMICAAKHGAQMKNVQNLGG